MAHLPLKSEVSVLEIGCGSGRWVRGLFDSGVRLPQYLGLDVSSTMAAEAAQAVAQLPNARVVRGDARQEGLLEEAWEALPESLWLGLQELPVGPRPPLGTIEAAQAAKESWPPMC